MKSLSLALLVLASVFARPATAQTSEALGSSDIPSFDGLPASVDSGSGGTPLRDEQGQPTADVVPDSSVVNVTGMPQAPSDLVPVQYGQQNGYLDRGSLNPITQMYQEPNLYEVPSLNVFIRAGASPVNVPSDRLAGILPTDDGRTGVLLGDPQSGYQQGWTDTNLNPAAPETSSATDRSKAATPGFDDLSVSGADTQTSGQREFKVLATSFVADKTASGQKIDPRRPLELLGVALPSKNGLGRTIRVRLASQMTWYTVPVIDVGPWNTNDAYWDGDGTPKAASGQKDEFGRMPTNPAGIDLTFGLWYRLLGMSGGLTSENRNVLKSQSAEVVWSFAP